MPAVDKPSSQNSRRKKDLKEALANRPDPLGKEATQWALINSPVMKRFGPSSIASSGSRSEKTPIRQRTASTKTPATKFNFACSTKEDDEKGHIEITPLPELHTRLPVKEDRLKATSHSRGLLQSIAKNSLITYSRLNDRHRVPNNVHSAREAIRHDESLKPLQGDPHHQSDSSDDEEDLKTIDIHILNLSSVNTPADPEVHDRQRQIEDEPSPRKKQRLRREQPRRLSVGELLTTSEILDIVSDSDDPESQDVSSAINPRDARKRKRIVPNHRLPQTKIKIKFPGRKGFKINIEDFRIPKAVQAHANTSHHEALSEGFNKREKIPTGKIMQIKRSGIARHCSQSPSMPKFIMYRKQLTIVSDRILGGAMESQQKKSKYERTQNWNQKLDVVHNLDVSTPPSQDSGIATPSTKPSSGSKPELSSSLDPHNPKLPADPSEVVAFPSMPMSNMGPGTSPTLGPRVERNLQSLCQPQEAVASPEVTKYLSVPISNSSRRKEGDLLISQELSMVIIKRRVVSDSESSEEESSVESMTSSIPSNLNRSIETQQSASNHSDNETQSDDENENEKEDDIEDDAEVNEEANGDQGSCRPATSARLQARAILLNPALFRAQSMRNFGLRKSSRIYSQLPVVQEEIDDRSDNEDQTFGKVRKEDGDEWESSWRPRIPIAVSETEDVIVFSPAPFRTPSNQNLAVRRPSRISPQLPTIQKDDGDYENTQGSVILGDPNFGRSTREREIPETQLNDVEEDEIFSQLSYAPNSSYFERASQDLHAPLRKSSSRITNNVPRLDLSQLPLLIPDLGLKQTFSRSSSILAEGLVKKSLKEITHWTNSQFGTLGSSLKKRHISVPLLTPKFKN